MQHIGRRMLLTPLPPSLCVCVSLRYAQTTRDCLARLCVLMELWRETLLARAAGEVVETGGPDALALDTCRLEGCMLFVLISTLDEESAATPSRWGHWEITAAALPRRCQTPATGCELGACGP